MKKWICLLLVLMTGISAALTGCAAESITVPSLSTAQRPIPENDAMEFLKKLGVGWNLGNTFDAIKGEWNANADEMTVESSWVGVKTTEEMIDCIHTSGFQSIRIPVSWHDHVEGEDFAISERWLSRVQEVVDWAYSRGMYVILNIHHDEEQFLPSAAHYAESARYVQCIWRQLAERFRDYDEHLIMESMNEPRLLNSPYEWYFNPEAPECVESADCLNRLNQLFVDTVRASGGRNADRYLMVPAYDANPDYALSKYFTLPQDTADNRIIVSAHAYTPYSFALDAEGTAEFSLFSASQTGEIARFMNALYERYILQGIPVVIGEYGARSKKDNLQSRVDFTAFYVATASARNLPCFLWDNHSFHGNGENFGLLDRKKVKIAYPEILEAIMTYAGYEKLPAAQ